MACDTINGTQFVQLLVDQQPNYDAEIIKAVRPTDGWIGHVSTGSFPAFKGTTLYQDRFEHVWPNTTKPWARKQVTSCTGRPCAKCENTITWGASRISYFLEEQNWGSDLLCYDQEMHVTHAKQHFKQIISDILKPATSAIMSMFLRKRALLWAGKHYVATVNFGQTAGEFTYAWGNDANGDEVFLFTSQVPTSVLTPQMIQRRVEPLRRIGYSGPDPFNKKGSPPLIELVSGSHTVWNLDHLGGTAGFGGGPTLTGNWRFNQWDAGNPYWRIGYSGQIGDFAMRVDPFEMRFCYVDASGPAATPYKFRLVLPYKNVESSGFNNDCGSTTVAGLKSEDNPEFETAPFRFSFVWHKQGMEVLTSEAPEVNSELPYGSRNFAGKWQAILPNAYTDNDGVAHVVDNRRKNVVQFLADFLLAIRPVHPEWIEAYFHKAEPPCVYAIDTCCATDTCYAEQVYSSANTVCD